MGMEGEMKKHVGRIIGIAKERVMIFLSTHKNFFIWIGRWRRLADNGQKRLDFVGAGNY